MMSSSEDLRRIALSPEGTTETPHFDRTAFSVRRIYLTIAADGNTANFIFTPEQKKFKCLTGPEAFAPLTNAWGNQGGNNSAPREADESGTGGCSPACAGATRRRTSLKSTACRTLRIDATACTALRRKKHRAPRF
jgi:hypothetical protein